MAKAMELSITVQDLSYYDEELSTAAVTVESGRINLSEELAIDLARHGLSAELGCDMDGLDGLEIEAEFERGTWEVYFTA